MIQRTQQISHPDVVDADLDCDRSLSGRRQPIGRLEKHRDATFDLEANQSGRRENRRVNAPTLHFAQAGWNVSPQLRNFQIRPPSEELGATPQARCADARSRRQIVEILGTRLSIHDENVARILALELRDYLETIHGVCRQILERVYGAIDFVFRERYLELVREQALCPDFGQGLIQLLVARGLECHELGRDSPPEQSALDQPRLSESELGSPRPDSDDRRISLRLVRHWARSIGDWIRRH
jgi:hypothetical protein